MKNISIQIKIGLLLLVAVILLSATCFISYRNLSSIVSSIQIELTPDLRIVSIRDITRDLEKADNSIRIYMLTQNPSDLKGYYPVINGIDEKMNKLRQECVNDTIMLNQTDTISNLIEENIVIWNQLLYLAGKDNVIESLKQLSDSINTTGAVPDEKGGILKRVFARNRKYYEEEREQLKETREQLITNIQEIEEQGRLNKEKLMNRESQLATTSGRIKEKFYDIITRMESQISNLVSERGKAANQLAEKTYGWLLLFTVSGGLLVFMVLFIVIRYIRNAHTYQLALEESKTEAENLARAKELFLANVSHEIRTPVTAITGFTEQLLGETSDENVHRSLKIIKSSSDHLARIIDDILDLTKLHTGKLALEQVHFSIEQIFSEVQDIFERPANQKNTRLQFTISPGTPQVLLGDPYRLKQILINLVGNSVKFTDQGKILFSASGNPGRSGEMDLKIEVEDTGIGIDEDKLKIIFDDFTQAEMSTSRKYGGTGLGLSIVKKLVELHGGTVTCESKRNYGTRITCHLPFKAGLADQIKKDVTAPVPIPGELKKLRILIVDDEEYNRLLFRKILDKWEIQCEMISGGMDAIEILKEQKFDIMFIDIRMPGIDGFRTTRFIRTELGIDESMMQVVCISAVSGSEEMTRYREAGMNAFLRKPFTEEMLLTTILTVRKQGREQLHEMQPEEVKNSRSDTHRINLDNLYHISGGDSQFIRQMLTSFNNTTGRGLKEMQEAAKSGKWETVGDLAHKLLPPCRHIGALELYGILIRIEEGVSKKSPPLSIEKLTDRSLGEFEAVSEIVNDYIAKLK